MLLVVLAAMIAGCVGIAAAQIPTTTVSDTVYSASEHRRAARFLVSWNSFATAGGQTVPAGSTSVMIGAGGQLSIALTPNAGASPMGSYYTAIFHLSDGTTSREYWVVPVTVPGGGARNACGDQEPGIAGQCCDADCIEAVCGRCDRSSGDRCSPGLIALMCRRQGIR